MTLEMHPQRWGDPAGERPLPESTRRLVDLAFGARDTPAVDSVELPPSRLPARLLTSLGELVGAEHVRVDDATRRLRTRGKSTPDLLRARRGDSSDAPDAVVRPGSPAEVAALIAWAVEHHVALVPFGGGTSVTGGLVARRDGYAAVVSLDLLRMDQLLEVDPVSRTARLQPGMRGPQAEAALAAHGLTLGHFPQSFEFASIGGFAATRSSGQNSAGFGRFDEMVVGLRVATPLGELRLGTSPATAAGPDLRQLVLGSEGTLGVITEVTVRVRAIATGTAYEAWQFESFAAGRAALRRLAQGRLLPTVIRLSDEVETALNLASQSDVGGAAAGGCLLVVGHEGTGNIGGGGDIGGGGGIGGGGDIGGGGGIGGGGDIGRGGGTAVAERRQAVAAALAELGGVPLGDDRGRAWVEGRFHAPYLRDSMLDAGVLVETLETATFWSAADRVYAAVRAALESSLGSALVLCHVSHVYETGCSLYFTVATRQGDDPLPRWLAAKAAASDAIIEAGATITHHHAVGTDHVPWLAREIGPVGVAILRGIKATVDPTNVLNPGVLVP